MVARLRFLACVGIIATAMARMSHVAAAPPVPVPPPVQPVEWRHSKRCGLNCLYVMLRMRGAPVKYETLAAETEVTDKGTTMAELARVAGWHGISLQAMRATRDSIPQWPLPAIVHLQNQDLTTHYVLLLRTSGTKYVMLDCNSGELRDWSQGEFLDKWTGHVLLAAEPGDLLASPLVAGLWVCAGVGVLALGLWKWRACSWRRPGPNPQ